MTRSEEANTYNRYLAEGSIFLPVNSDNVFVLPFPFEGFHSTVQSGITLSTKSYTTSSTCTFEWAVEAVEPMVTGSRDSGVFSIKRKQ